MLGTDVGRVKRASHHRVYAGYVNDSTPTALLHRRKQRSYELKRCNQHHLNHRDKSSLWELFDPCNVLEAGIVHKDINFSPALCESSGGKASYCLGITQVAGQKLCANRTG